VALFARSANPVTSEAAGSFLKKRTKKLLPVQFRARAGNDASGHDSEGAKVFCFFFSKKKFFLTSNRRCALVSLQPVEKALASYCHGRCHAVCAFSVCGIDSIRNRV
jgi:hypothetical protein